LVININRKKTDAVEVRSAHLYEKLQQKFG